MSPFTPTLYTNSLGLRVRPSRTGWLSREAALSWLAFGLLLGAWNAADDRAPAAPRPDTLRGYGTVSVRAVHRAQAEP